jgi:hypothetical protein
MGGRIMEIINDFIEVDEFLEQRNAEVKRKINERIYATTDTCDIDILIALYTRATSSLYVDHMYGFKILVGWLGLPHPSKVDYPKLPRYLDNYEIQELAKILKVSREEVFYTLLKIEGIKE